MTGRRNGFHSVRLSDLGNKNICLVRVPMQWSVNSLNWSLSIFSNLALFSNQGIANKLCFGLREHYKLHVTTDSITTFIGDYPNSKVHGANMGPIWVLWAPDGPHVGPMNLAIWVLLWMVSLIILSRYQHGLLDHCWTQYVLWLSILDWCSRHEGEWVAPIH